MFSITYRIMRGRIHIHYRKKANRPINQLLRDKKKEVYNVLGYNMQASRPFFHSCCGLNKSFLSVYICSQRWISCSKSQKKENVQKKGMCETSCSFNLFIGSLTALGDKSFNINLHASKPICCCLNMLVLNFISRILNEVL